jgi:hypothetical protein
MESLKYTKSEDRMESSDVIHNQRALQLDNLPGNWRNTNSATRGIVEVAIAVKETRLMVRAFGAAPSGVIDWGEVEADHIYANSISSPVAAGFTARYHFDFVEVHLQANWNQGLLVLAGFTSFTDGSKRSNYFSREFFHR